MRHNTNDFKKAQTTVDFMLGPIKIKDGLFLGDQLAARDIEFIITNKVTHIINTVSKSVPNLFERFGVQYLSVHWTEKEENIFDKKNNAVNAIFSFIEEAMEQGECCLIHSLHGKSRACAVMAAYLMKKYNWSLNKTLQLINSKKEGLEIRNNYLVQMQELQKRLKEASKLSSTWDEVKNQEDLLLANTYINAKKPETTTVGAKKSAKKKVSWDEKLVHKPITVAMQTTSSKFREHNFPKQIKQEQKIFTGNPKSILKGYPNEQEAQQPPIKKQFKLQSEQKLINNINGNIVHVTVNNFITTEKKPENPNKVAYNTRPFSSDTKEREKKMNPYENKNKNLFGFDTFTSNLKNAYQQKVMGKPANFSNKTGKKKEEIKGFAANQRPSSANNEQPKKTRPSPFAGMLGKEEMVVTGWSNANNQVGKRRFPSSNPKQPPTKFK